MCHSNSIQTSPMPGSYMKQCRSQPIQINIQTKCSSVSSSKNSSTRRCCPPAPWRLDDVIKLVPSATRRIRPRRPLLGDDPSLADVGLVSVSFLRPRDTFGFIDSATTVATTAQADLTRRMWNRHPPAASKTGT